MVTEHVLFLVVHESIKCYVDNNVQIEMRNVLNDDFPQNR